MLKNIYIGSDSEVNFKDYSIITLILLYFSPDNLFRAPLIFNFKASEAVLSCFKIEGL